MRKLITDAYIAVWQAWLRNNDHTGHWREVILFYGSQALKALHCKFGEGSVGIRPS